MYKFAKRFQKKTYTFESLPNTPKVYPILDAKTGIRYPAIKLNKSNKVFYIHQTKKFGEYKVRKFLDGNFLYEQKVCGSIDTNFKIQWKNIIIPFNELTVNKLKDIRLIEEESNLSGWQKIFYNKVSKDPEHYQKDKENYNKVLVKMGIKMEKSANKQKCFILDTANCNTTKALINAGYISNNIYVPNWIFEEAKKIAESKTCIASCEDYNHFLERQYEAKNKFDVFFLDDGKQINPTKVKKTETRSSQDVIIKDVFNKNLLEDECIFAVISSFRLRSEKYGSPTKKTYGKICTDFISKVARKYNYSCISKKVILYGVQSYFVCLHLKKQK